MPDKKMTDNEIVKALECCNIGENWEICEKCPCCIDGEKAVDCVQRLHQNTLDLINRQKAEIENLKNLKYIYATVDYCESDLTEALEENKRLKAEIERLEKENTILSQNADTAFQDGLNEAQELYAEQIKREIKSEAYKEFAEKLEERIAVHLLRNKSNEYAGGFADALDGVNEEIDNTLNELVGEDDGCRKKND